jgi:hypothetical protein
MLDEKNDNLQDADGSANDSTINTDETQAGGDTGEVTQTDDLIAADPESEQPEAIDVTLAKEGKENDDVPEDLLAEDDREAVQPELV